MLNRFKPFLLWGGLFLLVSFVLSFLPYVEDVSLIWLNIIFWVPVIGLFIFPQTDRAEQICKRFPNLSLYFLYAGWLPYMILPLYFVPWLMEMFASEIMASMVKSYVLLYGIGMVVSYLSATVVVLHRFFQKQMKIKP